MEIKLLDTGYVSTTNVDGQTQLSDANRAGYTGSAVRSFTLKLKDNITIAGDSAIEKNPVINTLTDSTTNSVSSKNRRVKIVAILEKEIISNGWDKNNVVQVGRIDRTSGLKLLYPSGTTDSVKSIVEALGGVNTGVLTSTTGFANASPSDDNGTVSTITPYLIGRIEKVTFVDPMGSSSFWTVNIDFIIST